MRDILAIFESLMPGTKRADLDETCPPKAVEPAAEGYSDPLLLGDDDVAGLLGVTSGTVRRLDAGERIPEPVKLGNFKRWRLAEIKDWVDAGCPIRKQWNWHPSGGLQQLPGHDSASHGAHKCRCHQHGEKQTDGSSGCHRGGVTSAAPSI